jgi:hypothetical protein
MTQTNAYKEIIYLDEVELTSALAQLQGGLKQSLVATDENRSITNSTDTATGQSSGDINAALAKATFGAGWESSTSQENQESISQAMNVVFKDYQLDRLIHELGDSLHPGEFETAEGDFVLERSEFKLLDFGSIVDIVDGTALKNIMKIIPSEDGDGTNWDKSTESGFKQLGALAKLGTKMVPDSIILLLDNATIYAEKKNFRMSSAQLSPLMSTNRPINVLGIVEGFAGSEKMDMDNLTKPVADGNFANIGSMVSSLSETMLTSLNIIKKDNRLIKPIAVYFGKTNS